jgi:hypothetical protein
MPYLFAQFSPSSTFSSPSFVNQMDYISPPMLHTIFQSKMGWPNVILLHKLGCSKVPSNVDCITVTITYYETLARI